MFGEKFADMQMQNDAKVEIESVHFAEGNGNFIFNMRDLSNPDLPLVGKIPKEQIPDGEIHRRYIGRALVLMYA